MSTPKYLKNRKTGRRFIYTDLLAKQADMVPDYGDDAPKPPTRATGRSAPRKPAPVKAAPPVEEEGEPTEETPVVDPEAAALAAAEQEVPHGEDEGAEDGEPTETEEETEDELTLDAAIELVNGISSKDELEAFALERFNIDIDKRKGIDTLRAVVIEAATEQLAAEDGEPAETDSE